MRLKHLALAAMVGIAFAAPASADVVITEKDNGRTVHVPQGEPLVVKLTGEHASGYYWRLDSDLTPQLILSGRTTNALDVRGAPETVTFTFESEATGTVVLRASELRQGAPIPNGESAINIRIVVE